MTATIANRILDNLLAGDGCAAATRLGVNRYDLVKRIATRFIKDRLGNVIGWEFADGSQIENHGGGWDTPEGWAANG